MSKFLFFHYGPGGNCEVEKVWLSSQYPEILFWNQPKGNSFEELKNSCKDQIQKVFLTNSEVNIVAHSFGCDLTLFALNELGLKANKLILISPVRSMFVAFLNLSKKISTQQDLEPRLKSELQIQFNDYKIGQVGSFWALAGLAIQYPRFAEMYWHSLEMFNKYQATLSQVSPFDFTIWQTVLTDYLTHFHELPKVTAASTKVIFGSGDPYLQLQEEVFFWQNHLPHVQFDIRTTGHYPHFEDPTNLLKFDHALKP